MSLIAPHRVSLVNESVGYVTPKLWESSFNFVTASAFVSRTQHLTWCLGLLYVGTIFAVQAVMKGREAYKLKAPLIGWNAVLASLSTLAWVRMLPEFALQVTNGFHNSVCHWNGHSIVTAYWVYVLLLLKVVELGDTLFIVLRKQKLIFLHWYHHFSVLIGSWICYAAYDPAILWFVIVNAFVHSIMYSYYTLKAVGLKIPRQYAMVITSIQLLQMVMGVVVNLYRLWMMAGDKGDCVVSQVSVQVGLGLYIPFLYLFAKFFYDSYLRKSNQAEQTTGGGNKYAMMKKAT